MSRIYADNAHSIGNTPLVQINRIAPRGVTILAKIEGRLTDSARPLFASEEMPVGPA